MEIFRPDWKKLDSGDYSALVLAAAGLKRLGLENRISRYFDTEEMIPAARTEFLQFEELMVWIMSI